MGTTTDPHDGCLHEVDSETGLQKCYLVLPDGARKTFVRPVRFSYLHQRCGTVTTMGQALAETYAADPDFYGATMCVACRDHFLVGENGEFTWLDDGTKVGT